MTSQCLSLVKFLNALTTTLYVNYGWNQPGTSVSLLGYYIIGALDTTTTQAMCSAELLPFCIMYCCCCCRVGCWGGTSPTGFPGSFVRSFAMASNGRIFHLQQLHCLSALHFGQVLALRSISVFWTAASLSLECPHCDLICTATALNSFRLLPSGLTLTLTVFSL